MGVGSTALAANVPQLQNLIKRDPESYRDEFAQQLLHFESSLQIFLLNPAAEAKDFGELTNFMSHVASFYWDIASGVPAQIVALLEQHAQVMKPELRRDLCRSVMLMRTKDMVPSTTVFALFFKLFRVHDKALREMLYQHIVSDIKRMNQKAKNNTFNKTLQNFMYTMVADDDAIAAHMSIKVMVELYRKGAWRDAKTANVIATACFSPHTKVMVAALQFFLGVDEESADSDDDDDKPSLKELALGARVAKKTKSKARQIERARQAIKRHERREGRKGDTHFSALHLLHDPQGLAERLLAMLRKSTERFEVRLMMMNFISRLIGAHELLLLNFYPFVVKYLQPKQKDVTKLLAYVAQASHELVPPDVMEPVVQAIANNFVTERCSPEVMTVGLNSMRLICSRCPLAMSPELAQDLVLYKSYKDKSVMMAARSLLQLFRTVNPNLLARKDRGKAASEDQSLGAAEYGGAKVADFVPGTEVLAVKLDAEDIAAAAGEDGAGDEDGWEMASDSEDDSSDGEWVTMEHSDDEGGGVADADADADAEAGDEKESESVQRAKEVSMTRLLTPADFAAIKKAQLQNAINPKAAKRQREQPLLLTRDDAVGEDEIQRLHKRLKMDKEARVAVAQANKAERASEKWLSKKEMRKQAGEIGKSNVDKKKTKNWLMVTHGSKVRAKQNQSQLERNTRQRAAKRKQKMRKR